MVAKPFGNDVFVFDAYHSCIGIGIFSSSDPRHPEFSIPLGICS